MVKKTEQIEKFQSNTFEITGRITYVDVKHSERGNAYTRALMSKKNGLKGDDVYDTYAFMFFGDIAEKFADCIKKGDTVNIKGQVTIDSWEKDGKTIERLQLTGREFTKAKWSDDTSSYVADDDGDMPWA